MNEFASMDHAYDKLHSIADQLSLPQIDWANKVLGYEDLKEWTFQVEDGVLYASARSGPNFDNELNQWSVQCDGEVRLF